MGDETEMELLITIVLSANNDRAARTACRPLVQQVGGRIVESGDCSDEDPGCWSVTISRIQHNAEPIGPGALSRAVRGFMRELGAPYARSRVSCEHPTAWTVIDDPDRVGALVTGGERLLVEAWVSASVVPPSGSSPGGARTPNGTAGHDDTAGGADEPATDHGTASRPRLALSVDVATERRAGAEWPARALANRLSRTVTITGCTPGPYTMRVDLDLGTASVEGRATDVVADAVSVLGGSGWSRPHVNGRTAMARWHATPTPSSGIAAIEVFATDPDGTPDPGGSAHPPGG